MAITKAAATEVFRAEPDSYLDMGPGKGEVAHRVVGSGPDVLFVHGWPCHGATFRRLLPHLADQITCHIIDLPGAGSSRFSADTDLSIRNHIASVRTTVDLLGLDDVALVGHDSGGLIARHAMAGDERLRSMGLINTEMSNGYGWRFRSFIAAAKLPGFGAGLGWLAGKPRLRRNKFILGDAFADRSQLDGEFDEFFLEPMHHNARHRQATMRLARSFDMALVDELRDVQRRIDVPVRLVWGDQDPFFPIERVRGVVADFPNADLIEIAGAGLFCHEEAAADVAKALLPTLIELRS